MDFSLGNLSVDAQTAAKVVNPDRAPSHARTYAYPPRVWYFVASFVAMLSLYHFSSMLWSWMRSRNLAISSDHRRGRKSLRRIPLAVLNATRNTLFRITISFGGSYKLNITELVLSCAYIALLFTWALINTTNLEGVELSPQYYANRIGLVASTQFPLLISLGMKNNILTLLTGISFDKLNILHRISARVLCVMLWIHGAGHIIENGRAGNLEDLQETWFRCGLMAISSLTLLCILSVQPLRSRAYEAFIVAHFILAVTFLGAAYYHANNNGLGYYLWPSLMVWGFDRFLRLVRIFLLNGGYLTLFNTKSSHPLRAKVEVISPQFLRVTLRRPDNFRWAPGQIAYLAIPSVSATPWQAHPFTIASLDEDIPRTIASETPSRDESFTETSVESEMTQTAETLAPRGYSKKVVFLLRVHDGFTKRLINAVNGDSDNTFGAYIDGPYCSPPSVRGFETVLIFCGGSGISFGLPLLLDLIRCANIGANPTCRKVMLVWAVRHPEQINAISNDLSRALSGLSASLSVEIAIHVTGTVPDTDSATEKSEVSTSEAKLIDAPGVIILPGRPDVAGLIKSEVSVASGSISVNVCGTAGLTDIVILALRAASSAIDVMNGGPSITLHVEAFGM